MYYYSELKYPFRATIRRYSPRRLNCIFLKIQVNLRGQYRLMRVRKGYRAISIQSLNIENARKRRATDKNYAFVGFTTPITPLEKSKSIITLTVICILCCIIAILYNFYKHFKIIKSSHSMVWSNGNGFFFKTKVVKEILILVSGNE